MSKGEFLGEFEHLVLLAVLRLGEEAYGMRIRQAIEERTGRRVVIGAVYATLERIVSKGYASTWLADPTPERGGRAKRFFKVEPRGVAALMRSEKALQRMRQGIRIARSTA
ncbi:MAG TPA: helix-turn-helix transcriptional regulator [Candidatus Acidoferrales bacterium]|nr:helix-turn-helix transcriptional regulator [Candidatus Acidoferrales bacterium]